MMFVEEIVHCIQCGERHEAGYTVITDGQYVFCDHDCARAFYGVEESPSLDGSEICPFCGEQLSSEYESFQDVNGDIFCSLDCVDSYHEFREMTV